MELKVWVDGVARVVCGLSLNTTCQDVVIALAQSLGQTGRYILIIKLRGNKRQLIANDCPLQQVAQLGQLAREVQFILQRTGPSLSDGQDTSTGRRQLPLPRSSEPEPPLKHKDTYKSHITFSQGSSTFPRRNKPTRVSSSPRSSPELQASPVFFQDTPSGEKAIQSYQSKEDMIRQIYQQQKMLHKLEIQIQALEKETEVLEQVTKPAMVPKLSLHLIDEVDKLEEVLRQNKEELILGEQWEELFQAEMNKEQDMHKSLHHIQSSVDSHINQISKLRASSALLEQDVHLTTNSPRSQAATQQPDNALRSLKQELHNRMKQANDLVATVSETQKELKAAEEILQERWEMVQALNKELRQCNLQQFIQQTGGPYVEQTNSLQITDMYSRIMN